MDWVKFKIKYKPDVYVLSKKEIAGKTNQKGPHSLSV